MPVNQYTNEKYRAVTILHELGHLLNDNFGIGATRIVDDSREEHPDDHAQRSAASDKLI